MTFSRAKKKNRDRLQILDLMAAASEAIRALDVLCDLNQDKMQRQQPGIVWFPVYYVEKEIKQEKRTNQWGN